MEKCCTFRKILAFSLLATISFVIKKNCNNKESNFNQMLNSEIQLRTTDKPCAEPINVMFVMTSLEDTKEFQVQLKSILYHRTSPLFLHVFVTDDVINLVMTTLLDTWQADQVFYKIYRVPSEEVFIDRLTMTMTLLKDLQSFVTEIIYLDSKIFFLHDVKMWFHIAANSMPNYKLLLSDDSGCAISRKNECNPSLMYINLKEVGYTRDTFIDTLVNTFGYKMGTLPCIISPVNVFSINDNSSRCFKYFKRMRPENIFVVEKDGFLSINQFPDQFSVSVKESIETISAIEPMTKIWRQSSGSTCSLCESSFKNMSIFLRKPEVYSSSLLSLSDETDEIGVCTEFLQIAYLKRRTQLFMHCGANYKTIKSTLVLSDNPDVTLLTTLTLDRFSSLEMNLLYWTGPAAVLFYITDYEAAYQLPYLMNSSKILNKPEVLDRIAIHLVYQRLYNVPINYFRNVLLNNTLTSHYFYVDVDFVPNFNMYESIIGHLKTISNRKDLKKVWVVPAFETFVDLGDNFPSNKAQLLDLFNKKIILDFNKKVFRKGHFPTNYTMWTTSNNPYQVHVKEGYEPYVIASTSMGAAYNENLLERMANKISYVRLLHSMGYDFYVLPYDFIIHLPHPLSQGTHQFQTDTTAFQCGQLHYHSYLRRLDEIFPDRVVPI